MAKAFKIAALASGSTFYEFPGNNANLSVNGAVVDDNIFGQDFKSEQSSIDSWTVGGTGFYKGYAGYVATIMKSGTSTEFGAASGETPEAMTDIDGLTFRITDMTKSFFDMAHSADFVVYVGGVDHTSDVDYIDYLQGEVTFKAGSAPGSGNAVTISGYYFPMTQVGKAQTFKLGMTADSQDITDFETAQANNGYAVFALKMLTVTLDVSQFWHNTNDLVSLVTGRSQVMIEIAPDGDSSRLSYARGYFKAATDALSGDTGGVENDSITFNLYVPQNLNDNTPPFSWRHATNYTLSEAIKILLDAWANKVAVQIQYLPDGTNGWSGDIFVTDISMSGGVATINEFSLSGQGSGALSEVGSVS